MCLAMLYGKGKRYDDGWKADKKVAMQTYVAGRVEDADTKEKKLNNVKWANLYRLSTDFKVCVKILCA